MRNLTMLLAAVALATAGCTETIDLRTARITVADPTNVMQVRAAEELEAHLKLIAGTRTPATNGFVFAIGRVAPGQAMVGAFESRAMAKDGTLYFWGDDAENHPGTLFAVYGFLREVLGVDWVRPGEDGIVFTPRTTLAVSPEWAYRYTPPFDCAKIRYHAYKKPKDKAAAKINGSVPAVLAVAPSAARRRSMEEQRWLRRMCHFEKRKVNMSHAFTDWNRRFFKTHPEYLAKRPGGGRGSADFEARQSNLYGKLCVSNEGVVDQIIADWQAKGAPEIMNACLNDGHGFCTCEKCLALDVDPIGGAEAMYASNDAHVTDRYVNFWNRVIRKAIRIRPDMKLASYAYFSTRFAPRREKIEYPENIVLGIVPGQEDDARKMVEDWKKAGLKYFKLRPNYLCYHGTLPRGYERFLVEDFKMFRDAGMIGCDFDGGPGNEFLEFEVYAIARVIADPDLAFERIENDYLRQFGAAAETMREYYHRIRERGEKALYAKKYAKTGKEAVLDDSHLIDTVVAAHPTEEILKDRTLLEKALVTDGLTDVEKRRIRRRILLTDNGLKTRTWRAACDAKDEAKMVALGLDLIAYRCSIGKEVPYTPWSSLFGRRWGGGESELWKTEPLKSAVKAKYPEMTLE